MSTLSEKYLAGFLDADGSIQVMWRPLDRGNTNPEIQRPYLSLEFSQREDRDDVLKRIQKEFGGKLTTNVRGPYTQLTLFGSPAEQVLNRIKKHLVVKRDYAESVLSILKQPCNRKEMQVWLKRQRRIRSFALPNYPSRKWAAGYFDGDGSISARLNKGRISAAIYFEVVAADYDSEGIEILQKAFGGTINVLSKNRTHLRKWTLSVPPSKVKQIANHFGQYLIVKKTQFDFLMRCAEMGHFRDGKNINSALKQLKVQPHRLNESNDFDIRDISDEEVKLKRHESRLKYHNRMR